MQVTFSALLKGAKVLKSAGTVSDKFNSLGRETRNGLVYLGFPFQMRGNEDRTAIAPGYTFSVRCLIPKNGLGVELQRALLAAWWLLGHLGGVGSRSRRGFGSLALRNWRPTEGDWPDLASLPLLSQTSDVSGWITGLNQAKNTFKEWFGDFNTGGSENHHHPHLGRAFRALLSPSRSFPHRQWDAALVYMGGRLQEFRVRRQPDYQEVKDQLLAQSRSGGRPIQFAPTRTSFGLPLTFRYSSVRGNITFVPYDQEQRSTSERHGSLLHLRLVAIGEMLYPLFLRLDGDIPGQTPPAAIRGETTRLMEFRENAMDSFLDWLKEKK